MTAWFLSLSLNWLLVPVAAWFARKYWIATRAPALVYLQHSTVVLPIPARLDAERDEALIEKWHRHVKYRALEPNEPPQPPGTGGASFLVEVKRRQPRFPWLVQREAWLVNREGAVRETDGEFCMPKSPLCLSLQGMVLVAQARKAELEELAK